MFYIADYLTEKYMCQKLDLLPPSEPVSKIRKEVCNTIENFAMDGSINFRKLDSLVQQYHGNSANNNTNTQQATTAMNRSNTTLSQSMSTGVLKQTNNDSSDNGVKFSKTAPIQMDKKDESNKAKLRDQYTSYLKTKGMV